LKKTLVYGICAPIYEAAAVLLTHSLAEPARLAIDSEQAWRSR